MCSTITNGTYVTIEKSQVNAFVGGKMYWLDLQVAGWESYLVKGEMGRRPISSTLE